MFNGSVLKDLKEDKGVGPQSNLNGWDGFSIQEPRRITQSIQKIIYKYNPIL